ncbi:MAG TPA: AraC family transcriptional regulator [Dokdonella sp.]|uniref:AraC family transcriptional regulator n=1 Tax=Dokdonella sp. TaxID=2291710 RepID=UPI002D803CD8|nr:AraC family transcriptional regulator [Dokdonella sp.]HET9032547.1 AraC family transcriptional regulator [Dokdonella sp.]
MESVDRLSALLERFRVHAHLFHAGPLCGLTRFDARPGRGFLHVLRRGEMVVTHRGAGQTADRIVLEEPTLLFYPRAFEHAFENPPEDGSDFVCATLDFEGGAAHPLVRALPDVMVVPLSAVDGLAPTLDLLFAESERVRCGQRLLADRLFEVLLLQLLRWLLDHPQQYALPAGLLSGLAHPQLARVLTALHEQPGQPWSLASMAHTAGMSRSAFAACFKEHVGTSPADYLKHWRISIAQSLLVGGTSIKSVSHQLGYSSAAALSRAFAQSVGVAPRTWLQSIA